MLAITGVPTGGASNGLVVVTSPDMFGAAADDAFITRTASGQLLVAKDSSFTGIALQGNYPTPDILYVTNGAADVGPGAMALGNNRTAITGGPGYQQDALERPTTHFVLREGRVNNPAWALGTGNNPIVNPSPPAYPGTPIELNYIINNRVRGTIAYDGGQWSFEEGPSGTVYVRQDVPAASGIAPRSVTINRKQQTNFGLGLRSDIQTTWSEPVASVSHRVSGVPQPPVADVRYVTTGSEGFATVDRLRADIVSPSADPSYAPGIFASFDVFDAVGAGASTTIIEGTLKGTVTVNTFDSASNQVVLQFPFTTDINGGRNLYFGLQTVGRDEWLTIRGTYDDSGTIYLEFRNAFDPDGNGGPLTADSYQVLPGVVTVKGPIDPLTGQPTDSVTFAKYVTPQQPNDFTLWAGYDLPSQLWADLRASGSKIDIDSPVIVATPAESATSNVRDVDLRATNINIQARVQSQDDLYIGPSRADTPVKPVPAERVTVDANVAVPRKVEIEVSDDPATVDSGDPEVDFTRGQLLVSQTGSIGGTFTNIPAPFGGDGLAITEEDEPNDVNAQANDISSSFRTLGNDTYLTSITGSIAPANDRDFYKLVLRPFDTLQVSIYGLTLADPEVQIETATGTVLAFNDDAYGLNSYLRYPNTTGANQEVYIRVRGYAPNKSNSGTGSYRLEATVQGAAIPLTSTVLITADSSDVFLEGVVAGVNQSYLMRSYSPDKDKAPFVLTTTSPRTGASVGQIRGKSLQVLMANEADTPLDESIAYNTVDIATAVDTVRVRASIKQNGTVTSASGPFPYEFTLREEDGISIDAVPASSRDLNFTSDGPMAWTAALATAGDVQIVTRNQSPGYSSFTSSAPITSTVGSIDIHASEVTLGSTVAVSVKAPNDPTRNDIVLTAENGNVLVNGVLRSPNSISVTQRGKGSTLVAGTGRVKAGTLAVLANAVGRTDLSPADVLFFLRTDVDSVSADVQTGFAINEVNDVAVSYLRSPNGIVAIRANGFDERPGSVNGPAISATLVDVSNLYVTAPNGSIDLRNDTGKRLQLGMPTALAAGTVESMKAAGSVTIITSSGGIDVYDAPFAGSGARRVDAVTNTTISNATYNGGAPGQKAGTISKNAAGRIQDDPAFAIAGSNPAIGRVLRVGDRILVKDILPRRAVGVYVVTSLGSSTTPWRLTRASDSDTWGELPTNTIVYDSDKGAYWRLSHQIPNASKFGLSGAIAVQGASDGFAPVTTITPSLVVPANDVRYVVSSSDGTNTGPGSLGKMIRLRQDNSPIDPALVQSIAFSRLLTQPIVLRDELPAIRVPMVLDAAVAARVLPAGTAPPQGAAGIVINGQQITATQKGAALYRGTTSGSVSRATPSSVVLSAAFPDTPELRVGMAVSGNGVVPGTVIRAITPGTGSVGTVLVLSAPVTAIFNSVTNLATVSLTFSTELNGLAFVGNAAGSRLAALNVGGFTSGAAVIVAVPDPATLPAWASLPLTEPVRGVTLDQVNIGSDGATSPTRLGNQVGVLVAGNGTANLLGGQVTSNSIAGVRTIDQASVWVYGTVVGTQSLPNIVGVDLGGQSATIGRVPSLQLVNAADTFVTYNRRGIVLRSGGNTVQNTLVSSNSFEGISIEGGSNTIGNAYRTRQTAGVNVADSNVISKNGTWGIFIKGAALAAAKVFDNVFGTDPSRVTTDANGSGNVGIDGTLAGTPFVPNATTALDQNGNQHGLRGAATPTSAPSGAVPRPWQPRK